MAEVAGTNTELAKVAASLGVDLSALSGGSSGPDPDDPPIYFGETRVQTADGDVLRAKGGRNKYGGVTTKPLTQANAAFYEMSQAELIAFQQRLVGAGVLDPDKLRLGDYDDDSYSAWSAINQRTAKFNSVGKKVTPNDVLTMIERVYDPRQEEPDKAEARRNLLASFGTDLHVYRRSDPASIRQTAEAAFREAIGRKPKKDELEKFTARFLGAERSNQSAGFAAQDSLTAASRDRALAAVDAADGGAGANGAEPVVSAANEEGMSESDVLWNRLQRMIADAPGKITPGKRSRDLETQKKLYARYKAGGPLAAKPGTSKHGDGRANDLKYENEATRQWALANASKYGLSFPIYDPKKKRSHDESWHVEVMVGPGLGKGRATPADPAAAPISTSITDQAQDVGSQALEFARAQNPVETAAYDIGGQFQNMLSILSKGVV